MRLEFTRQLFEKYSNIKFQENPYTGRRVFPRVRTDRRTNMTQLIVIFANASKN